jgi:hypothetical protein
VHVVEIMKKDDEELYVPDDVLEEASAANYPMFPKNQKINKERMKTSE